MNTNKIEIKNLSFWRDESKVLDSVNLGIPEKTLTAIIGTTGSGKSELLQCINRMNEVLYNSIQREGEVFVEDMGNIMENNVNLNALRRRVAMLFPRGIFFPFSIQRNIELALEASSQNNKEPQSETIEKVLQQTGLWKELHDRLKAPAHTLTHSQIQRLSLARALATNPDVLLLNEPTSSLDYYSAELIEELILELKESMTIVMITQNMQQAARISDFTAFFYEGKLIENGATNTIFTRPSKELTENYITGRFG